jgi:hypothetical protein
VITLLVNVYNEDPGPAIASAYEQLGPLLDRQYVLEGRYAGFPDLDQGAAAVFASEHAKRNAMLAMLGEPDPSRWLFWLDSDERVSRASPMLRYQLERTSENIVGVRFVDPLPPDPELVPALADPRRRLRDTVADNFKGRLYRHLPGLEYRGRHDNLYLGETLLSGWRYSNVSKAAHELVPAEQVDLELVHLWWLQPGERQEAKHAFYTGPIRTSEMQPASEAERDPLAWHDSNERKE